MPGQLSLQDNGEKCAFRNVSPSAAEQRQAAWALRQEPVRGKHLTAHLGQELRQVPTLLAARRPALLALIGRADQQALGEVPAVTR